MNKTLKNNLLIHFIGILLLLSTILPALAQINVGFENKTITVKGISPQNLKSVMVSIYSQRNSFISHYHEISKLNPDTIGLQNNDKTAQWNIFYPVVDLKTTPEMHGIMEFDKSPVTQYSVNGMFFTDIFNLNSNKIEIDVNLLLNWENNIYIQPFQDKPTRFYITDNVPVVNGYFEKKYKTLTDDWSGEVVIQTDEVEELYRGAIQKDKAVKKEDFLKQYQGKGLINERLLASLRATIDFTIACQDLSPNSLTRGGLNIFYDMDAKTYRRPTWIWAWGPSVKLLIDCSDISDLQRHYKPGVLLKTAQEIGETSLKFQEKNKNSPAYGIITSRWSENIQTLTENAGFEQYFSVADAQFLAGWGWIPLYQATGKKEFLNGVKLLTEATEKLVNQFDIVPMDYLYKASKWKNYALNEQGFGTEGINELNKVQPNEHYKEIGDKYMKMLLKKFDTEEGLWNRSYRIDEKKKIPSAYHTRGEGWAMEGLLAAFELTGEQDYLRKAEKMADILVNYQLSNGSWSYTFTEKNENEISEKGTALWCLLFYKLYNLTKNERYLITARDALEWCLNNQYFGPDSLAYGGLPGISRQSGVIYRAWFPMECTYSSAFFGLAVLEELKLRNNN